MTVADLKHILNKRPDDDAFIDQTRLDKAMQILKDNGIDEDECEIVLQALGYALLDTELFPNQ